MKDQPIKPLAKGKTPTLLDTSKANELIRVVNAIATMKVVPAGSGKFSVAGDAAVLDLGDTGGDDGTRLSKLENIVRSMITSISAGNIVANCNANTNSINITLTYPNFPNANF